MTEQDVRTFTAEDLPQVAAAHETVTAFKAFLLSRFIEWTNQGTPLDDRGRKIEPVKDGAGKTSGGWGQWRVATGGLFTAPDAYEFEHWMADDRGPSTLTATVAVPASFIFGDDEEQAAYEQYLTLKARFEPNA